MPVKRIKKSNYALSQEEKNECQKVIHATSAAAAAAGAGWAQIPLADTFLITPLQITMIISLGKIFGQKITESAAKGILTSMVTGYVGRSITQVAWGWLPGIGNASNAVIAGALTETIGWACVDNFYVKKYLSDTKDENTGINNTNYLRTEFMLLLKRLLLIKKAEMFFCGAWTVKDNREEFMNLLDDLEKMTDDIDAKIGRIYEVREKLYQMF